MTTGRSKSPAYRAPSHVDRIGEAELLSFCGRTLANDRTSLFATDQQAGLTIFYAGNLEILKRPAVAVIGSRQVSPEGIARAHRIAKLLGDNDVTVVSGLAKGVDTAAHSGAIRSGGSTVGVIGTPVDKAYPAENSKLQQEIYEHHLLISQFPIGTRTFPSDFPKRNRTMAAISDASIIVEASDTSGTLHQAAECVRLGRWLFIMQSVAEDTRLSWPQKILNQPKVAVLSSVDDVLARIGR